MDEKIHTNINTFRHTDLHTSLRMRVRVCLKTSEVKTMWERRSLSYRNILTIESFIEIRTIHGKCRKRVKYVLVP